MEHDNSKLSFYDEDINEMSQQELINQFEIALMRSIISFDDSLIKNLKFQLHMVSAVAISSELLVKGAEPTFLNSLSNEGMDVKKSLVDKDDKFLKTLLEKVYIDDYSSFESFLSELMAIIYWYFPRFLLNNDKTNSTINVSYDDIFKSNNILFARKTIIDLKIKDIIQGSNIKEIINKFKTLFAIKIDIDEDKIRQLITISNNRNVLIHNKGIINKIYINTLKMNDIEPEYKVNDKLVIDDTIYRSASNLLKEIADLIYSHIIEKIEQIQIYYKNRFRE